MDTTRLKTIAEIKLFMSLYPNNFWAKKFAEEICIPKIKGDGTYCGSSAALLGNNYAPEKSNENKPICKKCAELLLAEVSSKRTLRDIAIEIRKDWKKEYFGATPYLDAMHSLEDMNSSYGYDSASSIINYFLGNASTWRGETAKRIKLELKNLLEN